MEMHLVVLSVTEDEVAFVECSQVDEKCYND